MTETALERITRCLSQVTGYTPPNGKADWLCPAHDDSTPSLSVAQGNKGVVIKCQAGCATADVLGALSLRAADLFDGDTRPQNGTTRRELVDAYQYIDEEGTLLFEVVRFRDADGKKAFQQRRPLPDGGWEWKLGDTRRVIYRLPQVIAAIADGQPIFIVEGEKDVHAIEAAGGVATCNPGGAGKWRAEYAEIFAGAEVCIVADNDGTGIKHAADVEASLAKIAKRTTIVKAAVGKDAADHLASGHGLEEWLAVLRPRALERTLLGHLMRTGVPAPAMVHKWLYAGGMHSLQGEPGVGKSWVALWLCLQLMEAGYAAVYIDEEGGEELVTERLLALGAGPDMVDERFFYFPFPEREWNAGDIEALAELLASIRLSVGAVVLDSLPDFLEAAGLSEDGGGDVTGFVRRILRPCRDVGAALLVLDHLSKPATDAAPKKKRTKYARGSGAKLAKAHLTMLLEAPEEFDKHTSGKLYLWGTKDRRGASGLPRINKPPLILGVEVEHGTLSIEVKTDAGQGGEQAAWDGPTHCMDAVLRFLMENEGVQYSANQLGVQMKAAGLSFRRQTILEAAERLGNEGEIGVSVGPRKARMYCFVEGGAEEGRLSDGF